MTKKKYTLKPGNHQFAPGSNAIHNNENLSDTEAEWYIEKYPHIVSLFEIQNQEDSSIAKPVKSPNIIGEITQIISEIPAHEDLSTTN